MSRGLLDTSVFVAREQRRALGSLPEQVAISAMTIAELELGVLAVDDPDIRAVRADTLALARAADPLAVTEAVAGAFARLVDDCRRAGVRSRVVDALIAATAVEHGLPVVTQDDNFELIAAVHPRLRVMRV